MQDDRLVVVERAEAPLSREQKAGLFFVIVCGLGALIFGVQYVWTHMAKPFAITYNGPRMVTGAEKESAEIAEQKAADTDNDQVSDYDELYIFKTSPYLNDSDSDGQSDGAEINSGQDPNCAAGATCESTILNNSEAVVKDNPGFLEEQAGASQAEIDRVEASLEALRNLPVAEIRVLLVQAGASTEEITALSDEDVRTLYNDLLAELEASGALQQLADQVLQNDTTTTP